MSIGVAVKVAAVTSVSNASVSVEDGKVPACMRVAEDWEENAPGIDSGSPRCKEESCAVTCLTDVVLAMSAISKEANPSVTLETESW